MKTGDFYRNLTSANLNETFEKNFGGRVNVEDYSREQLEDLRNRVRTMVFQQEATAGYNDLLTNETYQKNQAMLQLLNTRIKEMLGEDIKKLRDKMDQLSEAKAKPDFLDMDKDGDKKEPMKKAIKDKKVKEGAKPDFLDMDKDGDKKEPMKKAIKDKATKEAAEKTSKPWTDKSGKQHPGTAVKGDKYTGKDADKDMKEGFPTVDDAKKAGQGTASMKTGDKKKSSTGGEITKTATGLKHTAGKNYGGKDAPKAPDSDKKAKKAVKESQFRHNVKFVNESLQFLLNEDEEGKAKAITAASDIVNDYTSWMQRVGQYQTKSMIELADSIKANFGAAEAEQFKTAVAASLSQTLEVLTSQREAISSAVAVLAGEATPEAPMGQEPGMDAGMDAGMEPAMEPGMDAAAPDEMNPEIGGDEFAGAEGPSSNRAVRESREQSRARRLAEAHSIISKLAR